MKKQRIKQIINEEISRAVSEAMSPDERAMRRREQARASRARAETARREAEYARRRLHDIEFIGNVSGGPKLEPMGPLPGMRGYDSSMFKKAYIDRRFAAKEGIFTPEDVIAAVTEGRAKVWSAGMIGGAQPPSLTVVPFDARAGYDEASGAKGYPYVYTRNVRNDAGQLSHDLEVVIQRGIGFGGYGPSTFSNDPRAILRPTDLANKITEVVPIDLLGSSPGEVVDSSTTAEEMPEANVDSAPDMSSISAEDDTLAEAILQRWNRAAGLLKS